MLPIMLSFSVSTIFFGKASSILKPFNAANFHVFVSLFFPLEIMFEKWRKSPEKNVFFRCFVNFWLDIYFIVFKQCIPITLWHGETCSCG